MTLIQHRLLIFFTLFTSCFSTDVLGQEDENSLLILKERKGFFRIRKSVSIIEITNNQYVFRENNKTYRLSNDLVKKVYLPPQIYLFDKNKFHYKTGYLFNLNLGSNGMHANANFSIAKRLQNKLDIGLGFGNYSNSLSIPTTENTVFVDLISIPVYGIIKYRFNRDRRVFYAKLKAGFANNIKTANIKTINNSFLTEAKLGVMFSSKKRFKHYFEIGQSVSYVKGSLVNIEVNNQPATIQFDIWLNNFAISYGIEFGR